MSKHFSAIGPNPALMAPIGAAPQVVFLKNIVQSQTIEVGDYTYWDDPKQTHDFASQVLYHFDFIGDKLIIGKFCAIADQVTFIMNGANHPMNGLSTYPFYIFANGWESTAPAPGTLPYKGDMEVGNDVWIGYGATLMPGVTVGNGAIVAAQSVVSQDVPDYAIVAGNPAKIVKFRFPPEKIEELLRLAWWDWPIEQITRALPAIVDGDLAKLSDLAESFSNG